LPIADLRDAAMNRDEFARFFQQRLYLRFTTNFGIDDHNANSLCGLSAHPLSRTSSSIGTRQSAIGNHFSSSLKYFSASMAAAQPDPAAVTACL
jgi:hypothetical protein